MITKPTIYTEEYVLAEVTLLLENLLNDKKIIYKGELIEDRPYTMQRLGEWSKAWSGTKISAAIDKIDNILLTRAVVGGLQSKLSPVMTKFHLINNFDWKDKSEIDQHTDLTATHEVKMVNFNDPELQKQLND